MFSILEVIAFDCFLGNEKNAQGGNKDTPTLDHQADGKEEAPPVVGAQKLPPIA